MMSGMFWYFWTFHLTSFDIFYQIYILFAKHNIAGFFVQSGKGVVAKLGFSRGWTPLKTNFVILKDTHVWIAHFLLRIKWGNRSEITNGWVQVTAVLIIAWVSVVAKRSSECWVSVTGKKHIYTPFKNREVAANMHFSWNLSDHPDIFSSWGYKQPGRQHINQPHQKCGHMTVIVLSRSRIFSPWYTQIFYVHKIICPSCQGMIISIYVVLISDS